MSELQHPDSRSFELVADLYERARPDYPRAAIEWLVQRVDLRPGRRVLDLGAGTGKLTRALVATGADVIAVEPGEAMLRELIRAVPEAEALRGGAEAIPLRDDSVDVVAVGQAFHWFRHDEAMPEIHRVLRPRGALVLTWNERDQESLLQHKVNELIAPLVPGGRPGLEHWIEPLLASELFGSVEERRFPFVQKLDAAGLADRIGSISFVAAASPRLRADLDQRIRDLVEAHGGEVDFPYVTSVFVSRAE